MAISDSSLRADIELIASIPFLPVLLNVVCDATGMGYAAVARVTDNRWIAGATKDLINFGLGPGGELPILSTICHEIRQSGLAVVIDHVAHDSCYADHHTPATYGFESYISFPIFRNDGSFFGTLCAIDPKPARLNNPPILDLFKTLANLIAIYLDAARALSDTQRGKLDWYASLELTSTLRDMLTDKDAALWESSLKKISQSTFKLSQLTMAMDPEGAFLT